MIRSALIIDDAFDAAPTPSELGSWSNFVADLSEDQIQLLRDNFPRLEIAKAVEESNFCSFVWKNKSCFNEERWDEVFGVYEDFRRVDLQFMTSLESHLNDLQVSFHKCGRKIPCDTDAIDLIVVDLFLGSKQETPDYTATIEAVSKIVESRPNNPPLVILMSSSGRLEVLKEEFREKTGLFSSCFRFIRKSELLIDASPFPGMVRKLERSYEQSRKIAKFHQAWEKSASEALKETSKKMRAMELHDYAQIRQLVLDSENEPLGSYILELFDRIFVFNVEADSSVIEAALELNSIETNELQAPYIHGQNCFLQLDHEISCVNPNRLVLHKENFRFGDLLRLKIESGRSRNTLKIQLKASRELMFLIISPACDLQRGNEERILLMRGQLVEMKEPELGYGSGILHKTVFFSSEKKYRIDWNIKHLESVDREMLERDVFQNEVFEIVGRLRESNALDLRSSALSAFGRVGLMPSPPKRSWLSAEFFYVSDDKKLVKLNLAEVGGSCLNGRDSKADFTMFFLDELSCERLVSACSESSPLMNSAIDDSCKFWYKNSDIVDAFSKGFQIPPGGAKGWKPLKLKIEGKEKPIGFVARKGNDFSEEAPSKIRNGGLFILLH